VTYLWTVTIAASGRLRGAWRDGPLAHRSFRLLAAGQFTSATGDSCYAIALPWLILTGHGSAGLLGMVLACYGIPRTALIPVAGALVLRFGAAPYFPAAGAVVAVAVLTALTQREFRSLGVATELPRDIGPPVSMRR
jgi:MFS family permease